MDSILAFLLRLMRRARFVFIAVYVAVAAGFLYADHRSGWTWFIVCAGALLCLLFWWLAAFWTQVSTSKHGRDGESGTDHG